MMAVGHTHRMVCVCVCVNDHASRGPDGADASPQAAGHLRTHSDLTARECVCVYTVLVLIIDYWSLGTSAKSVFSVRECVSV